MTFEDRRRADIAAFRRSSNALDHRLVRQFPDPAAGAIANPHARFQRPVMDTLLGEDVDRYSQRKVRTLRPALNGKWTVGANQARGLYQFVILEGEDDILVNNLGHDQISKGHRVHFAGEILFRAGELLFWTNRSGHYRPHAMLAARTGLPIHKFFPWGTPRRDAWLVGEALKVIHNPAKIATVLGWTIAEVFTAFRQLRVVHNGRQY